jgi:hypothetical protein
MAAELNSDTVRVLTARNDLPWEQAWETDFSAFDERFTLHDSSWLGILLEPAEGNEAVLVFEWDAHWLPEPLRAECFDASLEPPGLDWPFLFIRANDVRGLRFQGYDEPGSGQAVSRVESSLVAGVNVLEIVDIYGSIVRLEFAGPLEFLALHRRDARVLDLRQVPVDPSPEQPIQTKPWWKLW